MQPGNEAHTPHYDVIILGSGMSGTQMGCILAKHKQRVLIIEEGQHPRFTIGESTIPETSLMNRIIADRFGIPEIRQLTSFYAINRSIASSSGIKRNFGFVMHSPGQASNPREFTQCIIPELPWGPESHAFRQDIDAYLLTAAIRYGCTVRQRTTIKEYDIRKTGVTLTSTTGERFTGRFIVDCGGPRAALATQLGVRDEVPRYKTHSRSIYTHMVDVRPFDDIFKLKGQRWRWHEGTLHHMFAGGWAWVIPFDNHPRSTNPLVSVGVLFDPRQHPKTDISAQAEFEGVLARFPDIAAQFRDAKPVREWIKTDRLQYSAKQCVGDRWALMLHATGFIDPLFSRGLQNTAVTIHALATRLLQALRDDDLSAQRFEYIERLQQSLLEHNDEVVSCCYIAFSDFRLWDAFHRLWAVGAALGGFRLVSAYAKFLETGDENHLDHLDDNPPYPGHLSADMESYVKLFNDARDVCEAVGAGKVRAEAAAARIHRMLEQAEFARPVWDFGLCISGSAKKIDHSKYNVLPFLRLLRWVQTSSPPSLRRYFDYKPSTLFTQVQRYLDERLF